MKNIIFWAGLFVATFWDEFLFASVKPEKTKRQQQFLETGETAQYFIGAVEDELVSLLRKLFNVKMVSKKNWLYNYSDFKNTILYTINGGVKSGNMTFVVDNGFIEYYGYVRYNAYIANGYKGYYDADDKISNFIFGKNGAEAFVGDKEDILRSIWRFYIMEWNKSELYDKVENFEQIVQIAKTDIELAFIVLSGVPNIKKILS